MSIRARIQSPTHSHNTDSTTFQGNFFLPGVTQATS